MKIKDCKKDKKKSAKKDLSITIRISKAMSAWLKKNELSPTALFNTGAQELGFKEQGSK